MTWQINGCDRQLKDSTYLAIPRRNGVLQTVDYYGKKEALIRAGIVTEKMLRLEPIDNGFGITEDEFGNHMCFSENYSGPGVYHITRYLHNDDRSADEKDFRGRSIDGVDAGPIIDQLR